MAYFIGGWIAVKFALVSRDDYFAYAGIVGGFASVAGLLALTRPALTHTDIKAIELETLKSVAETAGGSVALLIKQRNFPQPGLHRSSWTDHSCQHRKLVGERHGLGAVKYELALADHVDQLDAGKHRPGCAE